MYDIDIIPDSDRKVVIFSANTPPGEEFLGAPQVEKPLEEAASFKATAIAAGLTAGNPMGD